MLIHSPQVTEAVLRSKLGITTKATREALIDLYLRHVREGGGLGQGQGPLRKSSKTSGGKVTRSKPLPKESKAQMLARLRGRAEALCRSKNSEVVEIDGSSFRLEKVTRVGFPVLDGPGPRWSISWNGPGYDAVSCLTVPVYPPPPAIHLFARTGTRSWR